MLPRLLFLLLGALPALAHARPAPQAEVEPEVEERLQDLAACEPAYALLLDGRPREAEALLEAELERRPDSVAALVWLTRARVERDAPRRERPG